MENVKTLEKNYNKLKDKLKIKFPSLTDADLNYKESEKEEMLKDIRIKLGKTREEWEAILDSF